MMDKEESAKHDYFVGHPLTVELYDAFRGHQYCYDMRSNMGYPAIRVIDHTETQQSDGDGEVLSIECIKCNTVIWEAIKVEVK